MLQSIFRAPRAAFSFRWILALVASSQLCLAQTQMAGLDTRLVWQRTSPNTDHLDGPVLYQFIFFASGTPGTIVKFDSNPRHLANSLLSEGAGAVTVNGNFQVTGAGNKFIGDGSGLINLPVTGTNGGTVTQVSVGAGLSSVPSPITNSGTISLNTGFTDARYLQLSGGTMAGTITFANGQTFPGTGGGTVTSIAGGTGLTGGTITTAGTLAIDTSVVPLLGTLNSTSSATTTFSGSNATEIVQVIQNGPGITNPSQTNFPPIALLGQATATTNAVAGIAGISSSPDGTGVIGANLGTGVGSLGKGHGVFGFTLASNGDAVAGRAFATTGIVVGVHGRSDSSQGIGGQFDGDTGIVANGTTHAIVANGTVEVVGTVNVQANLNVAGTITAGTKDFKVDDPLAPAEKYLVHSSIESSEMLNLYSGNVTLDKFGKGTIELPHWMEAENKDFRYQLTCIGGFAPVYIAETIHNNQFKIAGGKPGMKVSWQVSGVRNDAYARAHPMQVEQDKTGDERGAYLDPEGFGQPESKRIGAKAAIRSAGTLAPIQ